MHHKLLSTLVLLSAAVQVTWAENAEVKYYTKTWNGESVDSTQVSITDYILATSDTQLSSVAWGPISHPDEPFYYVVKGEVNLNTIFIYGKVGIILTDGCTLKCNGYVRVNSEDKADLSVYSESCGENQGKFLVDNVLDIGHNAGIGSSCGKDGGPIHIYGGLLDIKGATGGAGIGGGESGVDRDVQAGNVEIYGGRVTAVGGAGAAGIGAGGCGEWSYTHHKSQTGTFKMYGGAVSAIGGAGGAGVGGSSFYYLGSSLGFFCTKEFYDADDYHYGTSGGEVYVYGGGLTAKGGNNAAGIGSGDAPSLKEEKLHGGKLVVSGGKVKATGSYYGAGIGGGCEGEGAEVIITGGEVEAYGGTAGAGIGSGYASQEQNLKDIPAPYPPKGGSLTVSGGIVKTVGGNLAAAIGGGYRGHGADVKITGGYVSAISGCDVDEEHYNNTLASSIGSGGVVTDRIKCAGTLSFPDNYKVYASDYVDKTERVFTAGERLDAIRLRRMAILEPCTHEPQNGDAANLVTTYTLTEDGTQHIVHCRYCNYTHTENHSYSYDENVCACGKKFEGETDMATVNVYASTDGSTYSFAYNDRMVNAYDYNLYKPEDVEGLQFMGYLVADEAPEGIEMLDSEFESLVDHIKPVGQVNCYARYRYTYTEDWTWSDDYTSASATITWHKPQGTLNLSLSEDDITPEVVEPTAESDGHCSYLANYTYNKSEGISYNISNHVKFPYLYSLSLPDDSDNTDVITENKHKGTKVKTLTLSGRTLYKDGNWNTLCLPFDLTAEQLAKTPLAGAKLKTFASSEYDNGTLTLNFADATSISAGVPYLVKWDSDTENISAPAFEDVTIGAESARTVSSDYVDFMGCFSPVSLLANNKSLLYLGEDNMLYYPSDVMTINAFRAFFVLNGLTVGEKDSQDSGSNPIRAFVLNFDEESESNGISTIRTVAPASDAWFTIDGRRLHDAPESHGLYIRNGQKVMIE